VVWLLSRKVGHGIFAFACEGLIDRPAVDAWLALKPLTNPKAPPDPSYMPQYRTPQQTEGLALSARGGSFNRRHLGGRRLGAR